MFGLSFLHLLLCFAALCATNVCVSSLRFGSGLCRSWILGGFTCGGVWVGILTLYPTGVPYICVWGFFYDGGVVSPLLLLGVSGRLFLILFWCACSAISLGHLRFSAVCHAAGDPSGVPRLADSGWLTSSCGGGFAWGWEFLATGLLLSHFGFLPCASTAPLPLLPLRGSVPLPRASACLTPVC